MPKDHTAERIKPLNNPLLLRELLLSKQYEALKHNDEYNTLYKGFLEQLEEKAQSDDLEILEPKAHQLTRHFLKRKLKLIPTVRKFTIEGSLFDPHHHLNSIYVANHTELKTHLPDFNRIYIDLRNKSKSHDTFREFANDESVIKDVQFFGYPPAYLNSSRGTQTIYRTYGYLRGGSLNYVHTRGCESADYCGEETTYDAGDVRAYIDDCKRSKELRVIRFHMGETVIPAQGKDNVKQLLQELSTQALNNKVIRIGHGTHMSFEQMQTCQQNHYFVECCLSSNKETGIISKRHEYPLGVMLLLGVPVVIATDGGDIYDVDLHSEYTHAEKNLHRFKQKIKDRLEEEVTLLNGDKLLYKHLAQHLTHNDELADSTVTYAQLATIPNLEQLLSIETLLQNMRHLQELVTKRRVQQTTAAATSTKKVVITQATPEATSIKKVLSTQATPEATSTKKVENTRENEEKALSFWLIHLMSSSEAVGLGLIILAMGIAAICLAHLGAGGIGAALATNVLIMGSSLATVSGLSLVASATCSFFNPISFPRQKLNAPSPDVAFHHDLSPGTS